MALCIIVAFMRGAWERLVPVPLCFLKIKLKKDVNVFEIALSLYKTVLNLLSKVLISMLNH